MIYKSTQKQCSMEGISKNKPATFQMFITEFIHCRSNWNVYIQKTKSLRKGVPQLGVYLNRSSSKSSNKKTQSFSHYPDKRDTIKTWFKIYCPSRGPKHALTSFQSSPDNFELHQSWVQYLLIVLNQEII